MISNICLVDTPYALSIYLLKMSLKDIEKTMFFIGDSINKNISMKLPHSVVVRNQTARADWKYLSWLRIYKYLKCWYFPFANLYVQDHLYIASQIIGNYKYVNLPDGPFCYVAWEGCPYQPWKLKRTNVKNIKRWIKNILSHGKMYDLKYGSNNQCKCRWLTTKEDIDTKYIQNSIYEYIDAEALWKNSTKQKQNFIQEVFNISKELINLNHKIETLILTQPLREDCNLTDNEMYDIYAPYILNRKNVAIKTHPRDKFDWKKLFPSVYVIDTYAPMQLLNYIGLVPNEVITVSSSSISSMPKNVRKIVLGTKINQKIFNTYGDLCN